MYCRLSVSQLTHTLDDTNAFTSPGSRTVPYGLHTRYLYACALDCETKSKGSPVLLGNTQHSLKPSMHVSPARSSLLPSRHGQCTSDAHDAAGYLSAVCHDLDHRGLNNDFLIKSGDSLAIEYNDVSPLENHHLAQSFRLLTRPDCNFLSHLSKDKQVRPDRRPVCNLYEHRSRVLKWMLTLSASCMRDSCLSVWKTCSA